MVSTEVQPGISDRPAPEAPAASPNGNLVGGVALSLLTVALVALAFPPFGVWPLIWVAFVPMVVAQHQVMPARFSGVALGIGIGGMFAVHLSPGLADGNVSFVVQLWPLFVGALIAALGWRSRAFHARTGYRFFWLSAPIAWVALDFLRSSGTEVLAATFGFPAYAMYDHPLLLQPISVVSIHGLELLIFLVNWAVAGLFLRAVPRKRALLSGAIIASLAAAWLGASVLLMDRAPTTVRVAAVQTGIERGWGHWEDRYQRDVQQTRDAAAQGAQLVVWNEVGLHLDATTERRDQLQALARETHVYLAVGFGYDDAQGRHHNEVLLMAPDGTILGRYGKNHPGTFAGDYSDTGGTFPVYQSELGPLATIICYDLDFTDTARRMAGGGARLVATPSADVPALGRVHYTHLVFRAIENRLSMVKADNEFDSAIIDPWGRILSRSIAPGGGGQATLVAGVPLGSGDSPWVRWGDWLGWLTVVAMLVLAGLSMRARWTARRTAAAAGTGAGDQAR